MNIHRLITITILASMLMVGNIYADEAGIVLGDAGRAWLENMNDYDRYLYLRGLLDGKKEAFGRIMDEVSAAELRGVPLSQAVKRKLFTDLLGDQPDDKIRSIMTKMYEDPANSYIPWSTMYWICRDQLNGIDVSQKVLNIRNNLMEYQRNNNNANNIENNIKGTP